MKDKDVKIYNAFCESKNCPEYIKWSFGYGYCFSCKKVGESYNIYKYPNDCNYIDDIKNYKL